MKSYVYRNITQDEQMVAGVGIVPPGGTFETDTLIENPNLKLEAGEQFLGVDPVTKFPAVKKSSKK